MKEYLNKDYLNYLEGRSVALVGPASYLLDLNIGKLIDSYDIVVRVNRGLDIINQYHEKVGKKTDILYNCGIKSPDNGGDLNINFYKSHGVRWISTIPKSDYNGNCYDNSLHDMVDKNFIKEAKLNFNFHLMDWHCYSYVNKQAKCRANTGFSAIFDLLNHNPSEIFICGYSFYLDSFIKGYKNGCSRNEEEFAGHCFASKRHIQPNQWNYLKESFHKEERIKVDFVLEQILNMKSLSREDFKQIIYPNQKGLSKSFLIKTSGCCPTAFRCGKIP